MDYHKRPTDAVRASWSRRAFVTRAGVGAACLLGAPYISMGRRRAAQSSEEVLDQADARIQQHRKGTAALKLIGPDGQTLPPGARVRIRQTRHKFLFGCNIFKLGRCRTPEDNAAYAERFAELLNFATLPFYWWNYERQKGRPQDERTEEIIQWCNAHSITMKGHPLAWNYVDPRWLSGTSEEVMQLQMKRIERCVRRFKGDIDTWDVVNEAAHHDREQIKKQAPLLTTAISDMGIGDYVCSAFKTARQANPKATLLINDYRTDPAYANKVISKLVDEAGKLLYDVIGIQSHMHGGYWGASRAWDVCERHARFGVPLHFTETTVVSGPKKGSSWATTAEGEARQEKLVGEFYRVLFSHPAVEAITWWDFTDQNAWQRAPAGLVRADMTPKPAYNRLDDLIKGQWWTKTEVQTDSTGQVRLQGFLGRYDVIAEPGNRRLTGTFSLDKGPTQPLEVRLI